MQYYEALTYPESKSITIVFRTDEGKEGEIKLYLIAREVELLFARAMLFVKSCVTLTPGKAFIQVLGVTKKGAFPNENALLKVLYLRIKELEIKWDGGHI